MRSSLLLNRQDLDFLLHRWLDVGALTARPRFAEHSRETFDAVLDLAERIASDHFAPHNRTADEHEPRVVDGRVEMVPEVGKALRVYAEAGLMAGTFDEELGGMQLPHAVAQAAMAWFNAANVGTAAYPFLTTANARLLVTHGSPALVDRWGRPMLEGRWFGTMALSGPQGGSSLPAMTTRGEPQRAGSYRLTRTTLWMSGRER